MDFLELLQLLNRLTMSRKHQKIRELCHSNSPQEWNEDSASTLLVVSSEYTTASSKAPTFQYVSTEITWKLWKPWSKMSSGALERLCESFLQGVAHSIIKAETWQGAVVGYSLHPELRTQSKPHWILWELFHAFLQALGQCLKHNLPGISFPSMIQVRLLRWGDSLQEMLQGEDITTENK